MTQRDDLPAPPTVRSRTPQRVIVASLIGTSLEWYDFFLYGTASALVFNKLFFPNFDPAVGTLLAFGLVRARGRIGGSANILMLLPLITPEIVTAVGLLLLFGRVNTTLSLKTIILGHITFSISYVTVIVRARLSLVAPPAPCGCLAYKLRPATTTRSPPTPHPLRAHHHHH